MWLVDNFIKLASCLYTHLSFACLLPSLLSICFDPCFGLDLVKQLGAFLFISLPIFLSQILKTFLLAILESAVSERSLIKGCTFFG